MPMLSINEDEFVALGLCLSNFKIFKNTNKRKNLELSNSCYGCSAKVCVEMWKDLHVNGEDNNNDNDEIEHNPKYSSCLEISEGWSTLQKINSAPSLEYICPIQFKNGQSFTYLKFIPCSAIR